MKHRRLALPSAARTTAPAAVVLTNLRRFLGVTVHLDVTAASGTGGLTLTISGYDAATDRTYALLTAAAAVTATGIKVYAVRPTQMTASGGVTQVALLPIPDQIKISVAVGDASSYTYSVTAIFQ